MTIMCTIYSKLATMTDSNEGIPILLSEKEETSLSPLSVFVGSCTPKTIQLTSL